MALPALWFAAGSETLHDVNSIDNKCACATYLNADGSGLYFAHNITSIVGIKYLPDIIFLYYCLRITDSLIIKLSVKYQHTLWLQQHVVVNNLRIFFRLAMTVLMSAQI
jgi:hypothetical protein